MIINRGAVVGLVGGVLLCTIAADRISGQGAAARPAAAPTAATVIVPHESWPCGFPAGIPAPESGTLVFEARMTLARVLDVGNTPYGRRQGAVVQDGTLSGPRLAGSVTTGALDFELRLANGTIEISCSRAPPRSMPGTCGRPRTARSSSCGTAARSARSRPPSKHGLTDRTRG